MNREAIAPTQENNGGANPTMGNEEAQPSHQIVKELTNEPFAFTAEGFKVKLREPRSTYMLQDPANIKNLTIVLNGIFVQNIPDQDTRPNDPHTWEKLLEKSDPAASLKAPFTNVAILLLHLGLKALKTVAIRFPNVQMPRPADQTRLAGLASSVKVAEGLHAHLVQGCGKAVAHLHDCGAVNKQDLKVTATVGKSEEVFWDDSFTNDGARGGVSYWGHAPPEQVGKGSWIYSEE